MLPRFSLIKQRKESADTVLLNLTWGTLVLGFTITRKALDIDFEDELYPQQRLRNMVAISILVAVHLLLVYFLLFKKVEPPLKQGDEAGQLVFFDLQAKNLGDKPKPAKTQPEKKQQTKSEPIHASMAAAQQPNVVSPTTVSPVAAPEVVDTMSQIAAARARRHALQADAAQEDSQAQTASVGPSENDIAMARIKANIKSANYSKKGTNGVFQILSKGVQNGRFSFRGWTNSPNESTHQTFEVDAGIVGNVELAIVRKMIMLIREHYSGDFNWDSQRLGRVVVLSANPANNADLEEFLMREMFGSNPRDLGVR